MVVCRTKPRAHNDGLLDPILILFPEQSDVNQIVENLAGGDVAVVI